MGKARADKAAYILIALFVAFLIYFGWRFHPIENVHSPENDGYVDRAEQIRQGHIPRDPYRPLMYPLMAAGFGTLLDDTFAGARLTSSLFAGLLALFTYLLARRFFGREAGLFAILGVMLNQVVIVESVHAASDVAFTALAMLVLLLSVRMGDRLDRKAVLALALGFSIAFFMRYQAVLLLPSVIIALGYIPSLPMRRRAAALLLFGAAAVLFLLPHFYLTMRVFGSPFYNENWKNLAFKLYGENDFSYYDKVPFDGWISVLASAPGALMISALRELAQFLVSGIVELGGGRLAGGLFAAVFLFGAYNLLSQMNRRNLSILAFLLVYTVGVAATYETWNRYMLPILPLGCMLGGSFIFSGAFGGRVNVGRYRIRRDVPIAALFLIVMGGTALRAMPAFIASHPIAEVQAAIALQREHGSDLRVLGTFPFTGRHVDYWYEQLDDVRADERGDETAYYARVRALIGESRADYVIIGRLTLSDRPSGLLTGAEVPAFLRPVFRSRDVMVYEVIGTGG